MEEPPRSGSRRVLDRRTWALAALEAFAAGGPASVAVEPLAKSLGATKGSFYWHFPDRRALLAAALELYEQEGTDSVIATLRHQPDPGDQLRSLFALVFADDTGDPVYHAMLANAAEPNVAPVLARITTRRLDYLVAAMTEVGHRRSEAHHWAVLAHSTWLGLIQTEQAMGGHLFESTNDRDRYLAFLQQIVLGQAPADPTTAGQPPVAS